MITENGKADGRAICSTPRLPAQAHKAFMRWLLASLDSVRSNAA